MKSQDRKEYLRQKMLQGQCSRNELGELYNLLQAEGGEHELEALIQEQWNHSASAGNTTESHVPEALFTEIVKQGDWRRRLSVHEGDQKRRRLFLRAAASLTLLMAAGLSLFYRSAITTYAEAQIMTEHTLPYGEIAQLQLPDGSKVWLNAGSTLKYPRFFLSGERHVSLSGEAFFDVARDESKPFIIQAGEFKVRVLGTSFNVKAYADDGVGSVAVRSGLVQVHHGSDSLAVLSKGVQLSYDKAQHNYQLDTIDPATAMHWTTSGLQFENATFEEVVKVLERHFNVNIELESQNAKCRFTITMPADTSLQEALEKLKRINNFEYAGKKDKVVIKKINC